MKSGGKVTGPEMDSAPGPFAKKSAPIKVSFGIYVISILVVALVVFILMLVQYFPGYRQSYKLSHVIKNSEVSMTVTIPMSETEKRKENPFTKEQRDSISKLLKDMGAKTATVEIKPE